MIAILVLEYLRAVVVEEPSICPVARWTAPQQRQGGPSAAKQRLF